MNPVYRKFPFLYKLNELMSTNLTAATVCNNQHTTILVLTNFTPYGTVS